MKMPPLGFLKTGASISPESGTRLVLGERRFRGGCAAAR